MPLATTTSCGRPESSFCQFLALGNNQSVDLLGRPEQHRAPVRAGVRLIEAAEQRLVEQVLEQDSL